MEKLNANELRRRLWDDRGRRMPSSRSNLAPCPQLCPNSHPDNSPSFSISEKGGKVLFNCRSGRCTQDQAMEGLIAAGYWSKNGTEPEEERPAIAEPLPFDVKREGFTPSIEWEYKDKNGKIAAVHGRQNLPGGKAVRWKKAGGNYSDGGVKVETLKLYNHEALEQRPDDVVIFCEGEPACDALTDNGLLAVTNAGGASQRSWGESLQILRNRNVEIFPDADDPGRKLATELLEQLRYIAQSVRVLSVPGLNYKDDAVDYFKNGGNVEGLRTVTRPVVEHLGTDRIQVTIPTDGLSQSNGLIVMLFENMLSRRGALECELTITPPASAVYEPKIRRRLNLRSSSAIESLKREAKNTYHEAEEWGRVITLGISLVSDALNDSEAGSSLDLAASADQLEPEKWALRDLIPAQGLTLFFGDSASLKTLTSFFLAVCMSSGWDWLGFQMTDDSPRAVLFVDYENNFQTYASYHQRILLGSKGSTSWPENRIRYLSAVLPLKEMMPRIIKTVRQYNTKLIIIDSAGLAAGNPSEEEASLDFFGTVRQLTDQEGCTVIVLAHITKTTRAETKESREKGLGGSYQAYGSVFWDTSCRSSYYIEAEQLRPDLYRSTWRNRKQSRGPRIQPWSVLVEFEDPAGPIKFMRTSVSND